MDEPRGHAAGLRRITRIVAACTALVGAACTTTGNGDLTTPISESGASRMKAACYAGNMGRCDALARIVPEDTDIWRFAATCGGRLEKPSGRCAEQLPQAPMPNVLDVDEFPSPGLELAQECQGGTLQACDSITALAAPPPELLEYGRTCGGRVQKRAAVTCDEELQNAHPLPEATSPKDLDAVLRERLRARAYACLGFDLEACDTLAAEAPDGYERHREFGASCGQRRQATTEPCVDDPALAGVPPADPTEVEDETEMELRELAISCGDGGYESCARLVERAAGPEYRAFRDFGRTCGGQDPDDLPPACLEALGEEPSSATATETLGRPETETERGTTTPQPPTLTETVAPAPTKSFTPASPVAEPPPLPPVDPGVPEPSPAQRELLNAVKRQFDAQARRIYKYQGDLRVGRTARLVVLQTRPVTLRLSSRVRQLADSSGEIRIALEPILQPADPGAIEVEQPGARTTLRIRVAGGRATFLAGRGEIGRYAASPADAGNVEVWLLLREPEINGHEVAKPTWLELGQVEIAEEPWTDRFHSWLLAAGAIAGALLAIAGIFKGVPAFLRWVRGTKPAD